VFIGYIYFLFDKQRKREQELEQLQINSLESQLHALSNQINPHFFFNSLNGMSALIRKNDKEKSLLYVNKLSDIFRYILQSEHRGLVTLREELAFVDAYRHVLVVRFANKLDFKIDVDEQWLDYQLPVLSLLPLVENVSVHNIIDSEHHMTVHIFTNEKGELVVSNKLMPKLNPPLTNGSGIANLSARYHLLMGKDVKVEEVDGMFQVIAPLQLPRGGVKSEK
jgi:LytS/YehU family sensor histidine kinase